MSLITTLLEIPIQILNIDFISGPRLHFYSPEFRFFQNPTNTLHQSGGIATSITSHHERRPGNSDDCPDSQLASPILQHNSMPSNSFPHFYPIEKQQKQEDLHKNDSLATLMNGE